MTDAVRNIAILDIGKTNAKVVILDASSGAEIAARKMQNSPLSAPPYPHYDVEALWNFFLVSLKELGEEPGFQAISITAHGACAALVDIDGQLALPVIDYEFLYPQEVSDAYDRLRPDFSETGSPRLSGGLNAGAQLHYLKTVFPKEFSRVHTIMTWPQYWAWRLTGVAACEVTSLGCHTDLWNPSTGEFSSLLERLDITGLMAPLRSAFDALGPLSASVLQQIGLHGEVPVYCGIHDSNASLLPHLTRHDTPFSVVSTGTWVVSFAVGGNLAGLDPQRDTLANVNAFGAAVPSARFMGGREFELLTQGLTAPRQDILDSALAEVIAAGVMLPPNTASGSGPFPDMKACWIGEPKNDAERIAAVSLYMALMTETCLALIGADGPSIIEGPFAQNRIYLSALASATGRDVVALPHSTGTSEGAALLTGCYRPVDDKHQQPVEALPGLGGYAAKWKAHVDTEHTRPTANIPAIGTTA
jgi:sugar (pentulose or hexulose) kinase